MNLIRAAAVIFACATKHPSANALELIQAQEGTRIEGKYIVTLKDEEGFAHMSQAKMSRMIQKRARRIAKDVHGNLEGVYTNSIHGFIAKLSQDAVNILLNDTRIAMVEEDGIVQVDAVGSWGLDRIDDKDLPLDGSYNPTFGNGGIGVTTYVIDTGILASHGEFEGRATQVFNSAGGPNTDCNGHGTHVAGTIGAKTYGVANKSKLVGVKVLSCTGSGTWSGVIAGINWVQKNAKKPATANLSLGGGKSVSINNAIKSLVNSGVTTVVAAGDNNGDACQKSPASEPSAITVASTPSTDTRSSHYNWGSNWGSCVDIFAPGSYIKSPWIGSNSATRTLSGTSMASPHVCGAVALYLGQDSSLSPTAVASKLLANPATNTISNAGSGTPNRMLVAHGEIEVLVHIEGIGHKKYSLGAWAGTFGQSRRLEGFMISRFYGYTGARDTIIGSSISIEYMAHLEGSGDTGWTSGYVGSRGESRRLEGFAIRLKGVNASQWSVRYSAHLQGYGNTPTVRDGAFCGTRGESRRVEAILVEIVRSYHR